MSESVQLFRARTPTLLPATHTNSYALGTRDVVLVEPATPFEDEQREWLTWARAQSGQGRNLVGIVLTHHHLDHVGGAEVFARELGLPIWAHEWTAGYFAKDRPDLVVSRHLREGEPIVLDGPRPERWDVLHTPGHAAGHVTLHSKDTSTLIVGDMVASVGTILIAKRDGGHMATYLRELERLQHLNAKLALPAHGDPIANPSALFEHYIRHRLKREGVVLAALTAKTSALTLDELLPQAYADVDPAIFPIARLSLEAHLEKLVEDGVVREEDGGRFRAVAATESTDATRANRLV